MKTINSRRNQTAAKRAAYVAWLLQRLEAAPLFTEEAVRARAQL